MNGGSSLSHLVSVIVTTSPVPSHPSLEVISQVFTSFALVNGLLDCEVFVICDGYRLAPDNACKSGYVTSELAEKYEEYLERLKEYCGEFPFVRVIRRDQRYGFAENVRFAVSELISTKYVFVIQHDWKFARGFDLFDIIQVMESFSEVKYVSFTSAGCVKYDSKIHSLPIHLSLREHAQMSRCPSSRSNQALRDYFHDKYQQPLFPLFFFYDHPHIALRQYYQDFVFGKSHYHYLQKRWVWVKSFIEDTLGHCVASDVHVNGFSEHTKYGTFLWYPEPNVRYLTHVDGRGYLTVSERHKLKASILEAKVETKHSSRFSSSDNDDQSSEIGMVQLEDGSHEQDEPSFLFSVTFS